ncbi:MAG: hypothetical protein GX949_08765 [Peptococcaceae bacterium]|jgi:hypothetical protein|nr:hypothetical protein [Peptococcaceae bacterium]
MTPEKKKNKILPDALETAEEECGLCSEEAEYECMSCSKPIEEQKSN